MTKQLFIEGKVFPLPDLPNAAHLEQVISDCMESGDVFEISVGEDEKALTKLLINGKALTYAAVIETADPPEPWVEVP